MSPDPSRSVRELFTTIAEEVGGASPEGHARCRQDGAPDWMLQWRDKEASPRDTYAHLLALRSHFPAADSPRVVGDPTVSRVSAAGANALCGVPIVINDRVDLALALGHGVHLAERSLPTRIARSLLPARALIGRSAHDVGSVVRAAAEGADYVVFGPVFDTPSKRAYGAPLGLNALTEAVRAVGIPVLAIGGIGVERIPACIDAGAHGVALIRAVWGADSPADALRVLLGAIVDSVR